MEYRDLLHKHLKWAEGYSEMPYPDSKGIPTIGIGHNLRVKPLRGKYLDWYRAEGRLSSQLVYELLDEDVAVAEAGAEKLFSNLRSLSVARQVALVDLVFNMGYNKMFVEFGPTVAHANAEEWEDVAQHLEKTAWYGQVGKRAKRVVAYIREG